MSVAHPCDSGTDGLPCQNACICYNCWLFANSKDYNVLWGGNGALRPSSCPAPVKTKGRSTPTDNQGPSLIRRAWNYLWAVSEHLRGGRPICTEEAARWRLTQCENCKDYFDPIRRRCNRPECGCNMDIKVTWFEQTCPIGRWTIPLPILESLGAALPQVPADRLVT